MRKKVFVRTALLLIIFGGVAFAQVTLPGDQGTALPGNPFTAIIKAWSAAILSVLGDGALIVGAWKLIESHHRGAGILVGIFAATFMYYIATHMQAIMQWAANLG